MLLVLLAIIWVAVGTWWFRNRVSTPSIAVGGYTRRLASLDATRGPRTTASVLQLPTGASLRPVETGDSPAPARARPAMASGNGVSSEAARMRRRAVLIGLAGAAAVTLLLAVVAGGVFVLLHLFIDAVLLGYVLMLVQYQREIEFERTRQRPVYAPAAPALAATGTDGPARLR